MSELLQSGALLARRGAASGDALGVLGVVGARLVNLSGMGPGGNGEAEAYDWFFHAAALPFDAILSQRASPRAAFLPVNAFVKRRFATSRASRGHLRPARTLPSQGNVRRGADDGGRGGGGWRAR